MTVETPGGKFSQLFLGVVSLFAFFLLFTLNFSNTREWISAFSFLALGLFSLVKYIKVAGPGETKVVFEEKEAKKERVAPIEVSTPSRAERKDLQYNNILSPQTTEEPLSNYTQLLSSSSASKNTKLKPVSSPTLKKMKVDDEKSFKKYIKIYEQEEAKAQRPANPLPTIPFTSNPYLCGPIPKDIEVKAKSDENFKRVPFPEIVKKLNIAYALDNWADNMRTWFAQVVLVPLIKAIDRYEALYGTPIWKIAPKSQQNIGQLSKQQQIAKSAHIWNANANAKSVTPSFQFNSGVTPENSDANSQAYLSLEKYLAIDQIIGREQLINRIRHLSSTSVLHDYSWDGKQTSSNSNDEKMPDAQILMHLFCTFLDEKLTPVNPLNADRPFTSDHFAVYPLNINPEQAVSNVVIVQSHRNPPHFDLLIHSEKDKEMELWEIKEGPLNLFYCLVIFVIYYKKNFKGYLKNTWLGPPSIQLLAVLSS